jgi:hypothetical protein
MARMTELISGAVRLQFNKFTFAPCSQPLLQTGETVGGDEMSTTGKVPCEETREVLQQTRDLSVNAVLKVTGGTTGGRGGARSPY